MLSKNIENQKILEEITKSKLEGFMLRRKNIFVLQTMLQKNTIQF